MQKRWVGKNVDLAPLSEQVRCFLRNKGFETEIVKSADGYTVSGMGKPTRDMHGKVIVNIFGGPDNFVVEFIGGERVRSSVMLGLLTTMFGGGSLLLRALKLKEALEKLEKEFWLFVEETVTCLFDSAKHPR